jgi:hypothetical protein
MGDATLLLTRLMFSAGALICAYTAVRGQLHAHLLFKRFIITGWIARLAGAALCLSFLYLLRESFTR